MTRQCGTCPWRKGAKTSAIPGYCPRKHEALRDTIAEPASIARLGEPVAIMACHKSTDGDDRVCVGWAVNQLGPGNNIALRLLARRDSRFDNLRTVGPQHATLDDTIREGNAP